MGAEGEGVQPIGALSMFGDLALSRSTVEV